MNDDFTHVGTVRRRPRQGHQRNSQGPGRAGSNGNGATNGKAEGAYRRDAEERRREFERETYYDREERAEPREPRRGFTRGRFSRAEERKQRKALPYYGPELDEEPLFKFPFDPWRLYGAVKRNLLWIAFAGVLLGILGFFVGAFLVQYKIPVQLIRKTSNAYHSENMPLEFMPREYSEATLFSFMTAPQVRERVAEKAAEDPLLAPLNVTPQKLGESVSVKPTPNPDIVILNMKVFGGLRPMVGLANLYAKEVVDFMREVQRTEAGTISKYLQGQLAVASTNLARLTAELAKYSDSGYLPHDAETANSIQQLVRLQTEVDSLRMKKQEVEESLKALGAGPGGAVTRLQQARDELQRLLVDKTEAHPVVQMKMKEIARLEKLPNGGGPAQPSVGAAAGSDPLLLRRVELQAQSPSLEKNIAMLTNQIAAIKQRLGGDADKNVEFAIKKQESAALQKTMDKLAERQQQAQSFYENSLGYFNVHSEASLGSINKKSRWLKVSVLGLFGAFVGLFIATAIVMLTEMMDTTLRTPEDIARVTKLPVLASLGDLRKMSAQQQVNWAFRTLTLLKGKLSRDADQALVCGIISANHGEGRSTWVNLLVSAANQRGLRVLTVDTRPTTGNPEPASKTPPSPAPAAEGAEESAKTSPEEPPSANGEAINLPDKPADSLSVLSTPAKVAEQLQNPNAQPLVHIPLPGWVWNLERRKQWQRALEYWKDIDNLVIFVELPPACEQESVLLAEHLPQCLWLTGSGMADATETAAHIETLRHARCNLVGAVLNYAPPPFISGKITRWFNRSAAALILCASLNAAFAAEGKAATGGDVLEVAAAQAPENGQSLTFGASPKHQRAKWQERLTFGPGDIIDIHFYGNPALSRTNVFIGPDGRINYLEAGGVVASGNTVDELREKLDTLLAPYYPAARTVVVPVAYNSKKYFMLGKVNAKGAYALDRPLTLLEAVGRAKGLETGLYQRTTVEMADLGRSFIVRGNEKLPVDFEKLFLEGDLSQNIAIEPNDYIFFASTGANDIYVLGEVMNPGPLGFVQSATALTAIADRGGYSDKAFKKRVLVIRGSLDEPETFVVDTGSMLEAANRDFRLQPRDIVYVSRRPWVKAEELLDEAASSFIQGMVTTWAGVNVGPIITKRLLPRARNQ